MDGAVVLALVGGGAALGLLWRFLVPYVQEWSDVGESTVAADGTLAVLGVVAGTLTAPALLRWPGDPSWRRLLCVLLGTLLGGPAAVGVAWALVQWRPQAWGVVLAWPVATAGVFFAIACVRLAFAPPRARPVLPPDLPPTEHFPSRMPL